MNFYHLTLAWIMASSVRAVGFIGHGIRLFHPACAFGCQNSVSAPLNCTGTDIEMSGLGRDSYSKGLPSGEGWVVMDPTPACKANNNFYLQTVAFCIKSHCASASFAELDGFWARNVVKATLKQSPGGKSYLQVIGSIVEPPMHTLNNSILLNYTAEVADDEWLSNYNTLVNFVANETTNARYGLLLFLTGAVIPIALSLLRLLPWPKLLTTKFKAIFIDPPLIGAKHASPVWGFALMPTRGQALFIAYIWIINVTLSVVGYKMIWPHAWYVSRSQEVETYVCHRLGTLSVANVSLLVLYAGRNNVLLWLTNWSRSTFLLLHRWIACVCMIQAVLHSVIHLHIYIFISNCYYNWKIGEPYWYCGIIATLAMVIMILISIQPIRQRVYEVFLASHITLSIIILTACYLHILFRFDRNGGFENWLHIAAGIWTLDRVIRLTRSLLRGVKRAHITDIDEEYLRIDIPGVVAAGHVYLHFPTVSTWRIWENHPFSVAGVTRCAERGARTAGSVDLAADKNEERVVVGPRTGSSSDNASLEGAPVPGPGTVLLVRKHGGITSQLSAERAGSAGLPVLVEGSYNVGATFLQDGHARQSRSFANVICIAGGVGITGVLPALEHCTHVGKESIRKRKLYWGVRTMSLVHAVEDMLGYDRAETISRRWGAVEVTLSVGERLNLRHILESDLRSLTGGTTVAVCGPGNMVDDVRCIVSGLARHSGPNGERLVRLVVESFTW